ncbi:MAG: F0F1 ATP synthase subunit B [Candidatus Omnitrophica bacterium]|nr:F0F1 ATP synthase subunit B [Candidatus Omnitrophota bacterium]
MLEISLQQILTQIAGFLIVLFILKIFAWKPLLAMLDQRKEKIENEFKKIEDTREEVEELKSRYDKELKEIEQTARHKIQESIKEAQRMGAEVQADAREEAKKILVKARENVELEIAQAKVQLRDEMATMVLAASEKLLRERLDEKKHKQLVVNFIEDLSGDKIVKR